MAKIALPVNGDDIEKLVAKHFGWAKNYLIYDTVSDGFEVVANPEAEGKKTLPPKFLDQHGVDAVICFDLGSRAVNFFNQLGIDVFKAVGSSLKENIGRFKKGQLVVY
ncbi:MAG: NifB/NifX family molybdenum-iron cluster-binding protein [Patescibacteria group bacterium]